MAERFELKKSSDGQFYFTLHAANNEKILTSEMYKAREGATKALPRSRPMPRTIPASTAEPPRPENPTSCSRQLTAR
jgi:uncharacterized protein YegP (UPF0339 family)